MIIKYNYNDLSTPAEEKKKENFFFFLTNRRKRDESQRFVEETTHTRTIPGPKVSRLQRICGNNNSKL